MPLLGLSVAWAVMVSSTAFGDDSELSVRFVPDAPSGTEVTLSSRAGGREVVRQVVSQSVAEARFSGLSSGLWEIDVKAEGRWAGRTVVLLKERERRELIVYLFPAARLEGACSAPDGVGEAGLQLRLRSPSGEAPGERGETSISIECPLSNGRFLCVAPAGQWDARLRLPGHASRYLWGLRLSSEGALDLGTLEFEPGGSVVGWVPACAAEGAEGSESPCSVALVPWLGDDESARYTRQTEGMRQFGRIDRRGFFEFDGVAAGTYTLSAERGDEARRRLFPVNVYGAAETEIAQPLALEPLADLRVSISPARHPSGEQWRFFLHQLGISGSAMRTVAKGDLRDGRWSEKGVEAGRYRFVLRDAHGSQWIWEEFEVAADSATFDFQLTITEVDGRILLGEEPLAAILWFGGRQGSRRLQAVSDSDGRFEVLLPEPGRWAVTVAASDPLVQRTLSEVDVSASRENDTSRLEIRLPDTLFDGVVVGPAGEVVPGAWVTAIDVAASERPVIVRADEEGEFSIHGLGPGDIHASAKRDRMQSDEFVVPVAEDSPSERVVLVLRESHEVNGVVTSQHGPVAGAQVTWYGPVTQAGGRSITDSDGRFTARVGAADSVVNFLVSSPGRTFTVGQRSVGREPVTLSVDAVGGTLLVPGGFEALSGDSRGGRSSVILFAQGIAIDTGSLHQWWDTQRSLGASVATDGGIALPQMAPGEYALCRLDRVGGIPDLSLRTLGEGASCVSAYLPPGGTETLDVSRLDVGLPKTQEPR